MSSEMKGTILYRVERGSNRITSCFLAVRTDLLPSFSLTYAEGGVVSIGSEPIFSLASCPRPPVLYAGKGRMAVQW